MKPLVKENTVSKSKELKQVANTIRGLSIDAIDAANSGHPGLPLGCADMAAALFGSLLSYYPKDTEWINRDRFVLSAGHGSMLHYAALHLAGYDLSLDDIKQFRQLHSKTAGHPEYQECPGVETTTGPLGQGFATAMGMALAQKMVQDQIPSMKPLLDSQVVVLSGDGDLMEGVSAEAASLAGHLGLDNVIVIYDANDICLDGPIDECFTEDVSGRFKSYHWDVIQVDGHNITEFETAYQQARISKKPVLIVAKTVIGFGSPQMAGTSDVHGKALGEDENRRTKDALGISPDAFHVPEDVRSFFNQHESDLKLRYDQWQSEYRKWRQNHPEDAKKWDQCQSRTIPESFYEDLKNLELPQNKASRQSSNGVLSFLKDALPFVVGGSADLSCSDNTEMKGAGFVKTGDFSGRNIKYGVREFAMSAMNSGISLFGSHLPYCGTFLMFSDYMRNAVRLAALMDIPVIYQFTHDSVLLGEDGPTHQPVEHLASLRAIPNLMVIRPADETEVKAAWYLAVTLKKPVALILSRQGLKSLDGTSFEQAQKGAYIIYSDSDQVDVNILSSGAELAVSDAVASRLRADGKTVRLVSVPSFELFNQQDDSYQSSILDSATLTVSIEAQSTFGWHQYVGRSGLCIGVDQFGLSAPASDIAKEFGLDEESIYNRIASRLF